MPKRTTVTLDDDVAAKLDQAKRRSGASFREVVNEAVRRGLEPQPKPRKKFKVRAKKLGVRPGVNFDCVWKLIADLDDGRLK